MSEFVDFDGNYEKQFYDVKLPNGKVAKHLWPNAGGFDLDGRFLTHEDKIQIRVSAWQNWWNEEANNETDQ